jgi:DNA-binding NarL/FixJ family response regulator
MSTILRPSEIAVCLLVADGLSNKEIAQELGITVSTVKTHLYSIYQKLGVPSRVGVAVAVVRGRVEGQRYARS